MEGGEPYAHVVRRRNHAGPVNAGTRIDVEYDAIADIQALDHRAAHVNFEYARLHERKEPVEVLDREHLPPFLVDHRLEMRLLETRRRVFLKKALALGPIRAAQQRKRAS